MRKTTTGGRRADLRGARKLRLEPLEPRQMLTVPVPLEGWMSAIFDDGVHGTLDFDFSRNVPTVSPSAEPVAANQPRYGREQLVTDTSEWSLVWGAGFHNADFFGSGWDHDGTTPLAAVIDLSGSRLYFLRGDDVQIHASVEFREHSGDLMRGTVPGYRYRPTHGIVHEGLVVFQTERHRWEDGRWVSEGMTFIYTQDYGQTMHRVAQVGGGFDVPAIPGGVSDGIPRGQRWSFANSFPEKSADDLLGAWFPWTDYLHKSGGPKGGQVGLFRARREAIGEPWVVEPNVLVYHRWEPSDAGGLHAHSAGMFTDGMASFWGDVDYRNHVVRHVASDLENYTTATWTSNAEFQGAWSPPDNQVYRIANQGASVAPSSVHGEFLIAGDEQVELVMHIAAPRLKADFDDDGDVDGHDLMDLLIGMRRAEGASRADGDADGDGDVDRHDLAIWRTEVGRHVSELPPVTRNLKGSFPGPPTGAHYAPRSSIWLHHLRGKGYILDEYNVRLAHADNYHFSIDGRTWTSFLEHGERPYLYGDKILTFAGGNVYAADIPQESEVVAPLVLNPGGTNLAGTDWTMLQPPQQGNQIRRVEFDGSLYVYADTREPIWPQPSAPPPVTPGMPIWEVTGDSSTSADVGTYMVGEEASRGDQLHWFSAWHYSLNGDGIDPRIQLGSNRFALGSVWVTNNEWVPGNSIQSPESGPAEAPQSVKLMTGVFTAPRRWLMAVDTFVQQTAPPYPLGPGAAGPDELAALGGFAAGDEWTVGLSFGLPQVTAFNSHWDPSGSGTYHPIATIREDADTYVEIGFTQSTFRQGTLSIGVHIDGTRLGLLNFESIYFDAQDRAALAIAITPKTIGATLLLPRDSYGIQSRTGIGPVGIHPDEVLLSNAAQTEVSPLEWFAVQVHPGLALSTAEREAFIASGAFFSQLDTGVASALAEPQEPSELVGVSFEDAPPVVLSSQQIYVPARLAAGDRTPIDRRVGKRVTATLASDAVDEAGPLRKVARGLVDMRLASADDAQHTRSARSKALRRADALDRVLEDLSASIASARK